MFKKAIAELASLKANFYQHPENLQRNYTFEKQVNNIRAALVFAENEQKSKNRTIDSLLNKYTELLNKLNEEK